jgi:uncharacterized protein YpmB
MQSKPKHKRINQTILILIGIVLAIIVSLNAKSFYTSELPKLDEKVTTTSAASAGNIRSAASAFFTIFYKK